MIRSALEALARRLPVPEEINGGKRCPTYLFRWELLSLLGGAYRVYLHKFVGDDWALDLHDHPKHFTSIGLSGGYVEHTNESVRRFDAPWLRWWPGEHTHRLTGPTPERPCWTLVIVGPAVREWGFWSDGRWILWRDYVAKGSPFARTTCEAV